MTFVFEDRSGRRWRRLKQEAAATALAAGVLAVMLVLVGRSVLAALIGPLADGSFMVWWLLRVVVVLLLSRFVLAGLLSAVQWVRARRSRPASIASAVSVVIAAYNEADVIGRTLEALLDTDGPELEVIVVDDGSSDGTDDVVRNFAARGVQLVSQPHAGKAEALRLGFNVARHAFVVTIDADTMVTPRTVSRLTAPFRDRRVAAVAGNLKVGNQVNLLTRLQGLDYLLTLNLERRAYVLLHCVPVMPGALSAWRRKVVGDVGGFARDTLAEDTDMTLTLAKAGYRTTYASRATGYTEAPETLSALIAQRTRWSFGTLQSLWKHRGRTHRPDANAYIRLVTLSMWVAQVAMPILSIVMYLMLLVSPFTGRWREILIATAAYNAVFLLFAAWALAIEGESFARLPLAAAFNVLFRPLSDAVSLKVMWLAAKGTAVQWRPAPARPAAPFAAFDLIDLEDPLDLESVLTVDELMPSDMLPVA